MKKCNSIFITIIFFFLTNCVQSKSIPFSDSFINQFPSDPVSFQKKYGGEVKFFSGTNEVLEKAANIDKAIVVGKDFEISYWKSDDFRLQLLKITGNKIPIEGLNVIGKKKAEIIKIFGYPNKELETSIVYTDKETYLAFGFAGDIVVRASIGRNM